MSDADRDATPRMKTTPDQRTREEQNKAKALAIRRERDSRAKALTRRRSKSNPTTARVSSPVFGEASKSGQSPQAVTLIQQTIKFPSKKSELSAKIKPPLLQPTDQQKREMKLTEEQKQLMEQKRVEALAKKTRNKAVPPPSCNSSKTSPQKASREMKSQSSGSTSNPQPGAPSVKKKATGLTEDQKLQIEHKRAAALARKNKSNPPPAPPAVSNPTAPIKQPLTEEQKKRLEEKKAAAKRRLEESQKSVAARQQATPDPQSEVETSPDPEVTFSTRYEVTTVLL